MKTIEVVYFILALVSSIFLVYAMTQMAKEQIDEVVPSIANQHQKSNV